MTMRTLKLWVHNRSYNDTGDDILINPKDFPDVSKGDVLEIYHPEDEYSRLLLQVTALADDFNQKDIISIEQSIATQFQLRAYKEVHVSKVSPKDVALDLVELLFKDQYLSRSDMWRLRHGLVNTCAYLTKKIEDAQMRAQVNELWAKGDRVTCGMITEDTRIVFRSSTAVVQIFIQMSSEMWDFDINGDLYFEKAVNGFLTDLFAKWKNQNCLHDVTIVLFSRTFYKATSREEFPAGVRDCIQVDYQGRYYEDFYRVLVQNERYDDWTRTIKTLRKLFNEYPQRVLHYHKVKGQKMPKAWNSTASQGNFLETLNMSLNLLEKHYVDRNFDRTGKVAVVITPGPGVFEVDRELTNITKQRTIDCGVGSDLVCMGEQPLHAAPLFKFHNRHLKATLQVGDDYNIPHWMNHSFYLSKNQIQAHLHGSFIPRIKPPQQAKEKKSKSKDRVADFPVYTPSSTTADNDNFPFVDYDEYDAQVFKLPTHNFSLTGMKKKKAKKEPQTYMEAKKAHKGRIRRSSDDILLERVLTADRMDGAISIPVRSNSGDEISSSVPASDKCHTKDLEGSSDDEWESVRPIFGSAGSSYFHSKHLSSTTLSRRALINPFAPSTMHFKMTSNRRRWIHAFPTDPQGAAVQTHHFRTFSDNEEIDDSFDHHSKESSYLTVDAIKQSSWTQDSKEGSENTSSDQTSMVGSVGYAALNTSQQAVSSSLGSNTSFLQDYNKLPLNNPSSREGQRSWVWGPTGEQEWSPNMTTGHDWRPLEYDKAASSKSCLVKPILNADINSKKFCACISVDWKSLTIPASLPITTDYFPGKKSLQTDYVFATYSLLPEQDCDYGMDYQSLSTDERYFKRKNLTSKQVFKELVSQRLSQGFQVIVNKSPSSKSQQVSLGSSPQYQHTVGLIRARARTEQSEECYLSIGRIFHKVSVTGPEITVTRYSPRHPGPELKLPYCYRFQAPDSLSYDVSWSEFRNEKLENYNWNYLDQYICTRGEGDYGLVESLKFWRSRFLIMPCNNPATKKIIDGHPRCDIYEEKTMVEYQNLVHGFVRMIEILNRLKRTAKRSKLSGDSSVSGTASESSKTVPAPGGEANSRPKDVDTLTPGSPPTKLIEAMLDTQFGLPFLSKQPGLPSNCFIAEEAVTWCIQNIQGVEITSQAVNLLQGLVQDKLILHASWNPNHKFVHGFYFYCIPQVKDKGKDIEQQPANPLFQRNFFEVTFLPVDEQDSQCQPSSHLNDPNRSRSLSSINPATDDWRMEMSMDTDIMKWGQQSATLLHKFVTIDVDVLDKSDRPEWATVRYHSYYSPACAFQLQIQWMVATGSILGELVYSWARKMSSCGFHMIPVPVDPFALPSAPDSDSLRGPIFVPLDIDCLSEGGTSITKGHGQSWREKLHSFQIAIIRRFGFMPAGVRDISEDAYPMGQGEDYSHYVHCTGGNFILMEDSHVSSPVVKDTPYSSSFNKKSTAELRKDYIKRSQSSQFQQPEQEAESKIGYLWSWNFMSSKRWRSGNTGDEFFQDKMLADFRDFCSNKENRLQEFWLEWYNPFQLPMLGKETTM
ncbi:GATOR complex protein Iml1-like isoform X2 [Ylistrum balloti]|uniref:GATOR complex protein Iml1-like isoform X2 n=1 Tax=Ylistrum balloti TaxID=509963 RepID=UPI002905B4CF|nr:GATOR complex protein Iml1-like isoform X2 [Ylistrum balloti]